MTQRAKDFIRKLCAATDSKYVHIDVPIVKEALAEAFRQGYGHGWQDALIGSVVFRDDALALQFLRQEKESRE